MSNDIARGADGSLSIGLPPDDAVARAGPSPLSRSPEGGEREQHEATEAEMKPDQEPQRPLVVVGVDGSTGGGEALAWACDYVQATRGAIKLVGVCTERVVYGLPPMTVTYDPEVDVRTHLEKARAEATVPEDRVSTSIAHGRVGPARVRASADADLLVVGARGLNPVTSALLGSVSTHCVHHAGVPVVVVK